MTALDSDLYAERDEAIERAEVAKEYAEQLQNALATARAEVKRLGGVIAELHDDADIRAQIRWEREDELTAEVGRLGSIVRRQRETSSTTGAKLRAVRNLHQPDETGRACDGCAQTAPCNTSRILDRERA